MPRDASVDESEEEDDSSNDNEEKSEDGEEKRWDYCSIFKIQKIVLNKLLFSEVDIIDQVCIIQKTEVVYIHLGPEHYSAVMKANRR